MIRAIQELDSQHATGVTKKDEQIALLKSQLIDQGQQLKSQQEALLAIVQSQQEQIAQLQRVVEHQFVAR
jgi:hypothetical protein